MQDSDIVEYQGTKKDGLKEGNGTCRYVNGDQYVGEWINNKKHGQGNFKYK